MTININRLKQLIIKIALQLKIIISRRRIHKFKKAYPIKEINDLFKNKNSQYNYFHHFFWNMSPFWLKEHRDYFSKDMRGFGEDAFHAMWYFIFKELRPKKVLEIGIYRGQTISLFSLLCKKFGLESEIHGISPYTSAGDAVSIYLKNLDYLKDIKANFNYFKLPQPILHKGFSTDTSMINVIESNQWDLIYIDGNHSYEVAKRDFDVCSKNIREGGLIILDDASLYTDYKPISFATAGHDGPSRVANQIDKNKFKEILYVGHNRVFQRL